MTGSKGTKRTVNITKNNACPRPFSSVKNIAIIAGIAAIAVGVTLGGTYVNDPYIFTSGGQQPHNTFQFVVNVSSNDLVFGDSIGGGLTVNITGIAYMMVFFDSAKLHQAISSGDLSKLQTLFIGFQEILISNASKDTYPYTFRAIFADDLSGAMISAAFSAKWSNGTDQDYSIIIATGIPTLDLIERLIVENGTTYTATFGGVHYNSTLTRFDWCKLNLNGYAPRFNVTT